MCAPCVCQLGVTFYATSYKRCGLDTLVFVTDVDCLYRYLAWKQANYVNLAW